MKKLIIILLILAAALGGLYYQFRSEYLISKKEAAFIGVREKVDTVTAVPGTVQSRQDVKIRAELAGRVAKLYVAEEDDVEKGDPLIKVDDSSVQENLADLRLALAVAENNYQSLQKKYENQEEQTELQLANARRDLEIARTSYAMEEAALARKKDEAEEAIAEAEEALQEAEEALQEKQELYNKDALPRNVVEAAEEVCEQARTALEQALTDLQVLEEETIPSALRLAQLQVDHAESQLTQLKTTLAASKITEADLKMARLRADDLERQIEELEKKREKALSVSPIAGTVISLQAAEGDRVGEGQMMARVAYLENLYIEGMLDEKYINGVASGDAVSITGFGFSRVIQGKIEYIAPVAVRSGNRSVFPFRVRIEDDWGLLRPGMNVVIRVQVYEFQQEQQ